MCLDTPSKCATSALVCGGVSGEGSWCDEEDAGEGDTSRSGLAASAVVAESVRPNRAQLVARIVDNELVGEVGEQEDDHEEEGHLARRRVQRGSAGVHCYAVLCITQPLPHHSERWSIY